MAKKTTVVALDVGSHAVKGLIVEGGREDGMRAVASASVEVYPPGAELERDGPPKRYVVAALHEVLQRLGVRGRPRKLYTSVGGPKVSVKQIKSIPLPDEELQSSLAFEARKHLPLDETEAIIDYQVIRGDLESTHMDILLVATTRQAFEQHLNLLVECGLQPGVVDGESTALANAFVLSGGEIPPDGCPVILDLGARTSTLVVPGYGPESLFFAREIATGGNDLTNDVRKAVGCDFREAEVRKRERGLEAASAKAGEGESKISIAVSDRSATDTLVDELRRTLRYYVKESGAGGFTRIVLTGGGAKTGGIAKALSESLGLDCEVFDPFASMELTPGVYPDSQFAVAAGLAMRGVSDE